MKPFASLQTVIDQLTAGPTASAPWAQHDLTFSFPTVVSADHAGDADIGTFSTLTTAQRDAVRLALANYADVIDVRFTEVSGNNGNNGDLRFHNLSALNGLYGQAFASGPGAGSGGDLFFSPTDVNYHDLLNPHPGAGHGFVTYLHEIGHAMGLGHAGNYNGGSPTYENDALFVQDTEQYTVMSYFNALDAGADQFNQAGERRFPQTLMAYDIAALQSLYGANPHTRTGNSVYGFHSNVGGFYDFNSNPDPEICIYDAGGTDTLDFSGFSKSTVLNLKAGSYSSTGWMTANVSIAFGTVIENGVCGSGNDRLQGNSAANKLTGGSGNDTLIGSTGNDTLDGGTGNDRFRFNTALSASTNVDKLSAFSHNHDVIQLEDAVFKTIGASLSSAEFYAKAGATSAHDPSDRIIYNSTTGKLYYDDDGNKAGGHAAVLFAVIGSTSHPTIHAGDFSII